MVKKLAIDWDDSELRLVAAMCSGSSIKVTDASVIPLEGATVAEVLATAIRRRGLEKGELLVAIGRGKAELRDLQLPPVPEDELPDMVRFQAVRSFASAGDSATVDFLVTRRSDRNVDLIAAAIAPNKLEAVREVCVDAGVQLKRIALRPLAAAALFLESERKDANADCVLIDLLGDDAEIVVTRQNNVAFLRTVKLPTNPEARPAALSGELRRSLVAAGLSEAPHRVVVWGRDSVHHDEAEHIAQAVGCRVDMLDPFSLVTVEHSAEAALPEHTGRLAPLVGLLVADEQAPERLIDFVNPRKRVEEKPDRLRQGLLIGVPVAAVLLLGLMIYRQIGSLDSQIDSLKSEIATLEPRVKVARTSIERTERVDQFLDGDVNWLAEFKRISETMPPADQLILRSISAIHDQRVGGGRIALDGAVTDPAVIEQLEASLRDPSHQIVGEGSSEQKTNDAYRWNFSETITVDAESIRNARYEGVLKAMMEADEPKPESEPEELKPTDAPEATTQSVGEGESRLEVDTVDSPKPVDEATPTPAPNPEEVTLSSQNRESGE